MRQHARDLDSLTSVQPLEFAAYLRANGWQELNHVPERESVWVSDGDNDAGYEILLPLRRDYRDFAARINDALQTLEVAEQRPQSEILWELATAATDVVRIRVNHANSTSGSIPIERGVVLLDRAREMMLAAACAAVEPRNQYQTRKPTRATDYLSKVHIGQTERGSYVVNILSRVAPNLESETLFPTEPYEVTDPFERLVTRTLAKALGATRTAAEYAAATGTMGYFTEAVMRGVSANLCEAIVGMNESGGGEGLEIGLRWAPTRPIRGGASQSVSFPADTMPFIEEAARIFRTAPTQEGFEVEGYVIRLHRRELTGEGTITINSFVEGSPRLINVKLNAEDYDRAIEAHKHGIRVFCFGNLIKQGSQFVLLNPREFTLEAE